MVSTVASRCELLLLGGSDRQTPSKPSQECTLPITFSGTKHYVVEMYSVEDEERAGVGDAGRTGTRFLTKTLKSGQLENNGR